MKKVWLSLAAMICVTVVTVVARQNLHRVSAANEASESMQKTNGPVDLILINGVIYTGDPAQPRVQALAVWGEKITATGTTDQIRALAGPRTKVIDLHGGFAMPGFNDAHLHLGSAAQAKLSVDLEGANSIGEFQRRIRARVAQSKPGEWITGRGWDHTLWNPARFPTRQDLDTVSGDHPMFFTHISGHVTVANSKALEIAGITASTPNPPGGEIERDAQGQPDGMLKEGPASGIVARNIPPVTPEQRNQGIELALKEAASNGITSMQDNSSWDDFLTYRAMNNSGTLTARITEWLPFDAPLDRLEQMRKDGGTTNRGSRPECSKDLWTAHWAQAPLRFSAPYSDAPIQQAFSKRIPAT